MIDKDTKTRIRDYIKDLASEEGAKIGFEAENCNKRSNNLEKIIKSLSEVQISAIAKQLKFLQKSITTISTKCSDGLLHRNSFCNHDS